MNAPSENIRLTAPTATCHGQPSAVPASNAPDCGRYEDTPDSRWFCLESAPHNEIIARKAVEALRFQCHLPLWVAARKPGKTVSSSGRKGVFAVTQSSPVEVIRPFFVGYLFVRFDPLLHEWTEICRTQGVKRMLRSSFGRPTPLPEGFVPSLMTKGRPGDGVIDLAYRGPAMPGIGNGVPVRIVNGPFADLPAVCALSDAERCQLLVQTMGREVRVTVARRDVEAV